MMRARKILRHGETWISLEDLREALQGDHLILKATMLKVARIDHHDDAMETIRKTIAYWITELTGALDHLDN